ncbi:MAG: hypothetical protein NZ521_03315 [Flammeovirgaceae bacterium]|nr:hypothetical protein [Flammeovirgaceae bacterium]
MMRTLFVICLLLVPWSLFSQNNDFEKNALNGIWYGKPIDIWEAMLAGEEGMTHERAAAISQKMTLFWRELTNLQKSPLSEERKIRKVYQLITKKFFRQYEEFSTLADLLEQGKYDCLSATMLYAFVFDSLKYDYQVYELPHHVYLIVRLSSGEEWLIEPTEPFKGFYTHSPTIAKLKNNYLLNQPIGFVQLIGLQYYNRAVQYFNRKDYKTALRELMKANKLYHCERHEEMIALTASYLQHKAF